MLDDDDSRDERKQLDLLVKPLIDDIRELVLNIAPVVAPSLPKELRVIIKNIVSALDDTEVVLNAIAHSDPGELAKALSSLSRLLSAHTLIGTGAGIAFANKNITEQQLLNVARATDANRRRSRTIDDVISRLAAQSAKKHPTWTSHRTAVEIEPSLKEELAKIGIEPLKIDAIRKRVNRIIGRPSA